MRPFAQNDLQFLTSLAEHIERHGTVGGNPDTDSDVVVRLRKIVSTGKGVGYVFSAVEPILDTDDATTIIAKLRMTLQVKEAELRRQTQFSDWLRTKLNILDEAYKAQQKVEQES